MSTPIDQISRYGGSKHAGSMVVDFYSVEAMTPINNRAKMDSILSDFIISKTFLR